ncbi:hypothetical protein ACJMK2_012527 [Sinanodonta woodiana]|uniref:RING-type E3 ubiquitin transferase n=1 Tax=Sinanodonta woodiana TaxID=1069815 RepID=A0ABD3VBJ2_SINWO
MKFGETLIFSLLFICAMGMDKAILEIVLHKSVKNGEYVTQRHELEGQFSKAGAMGSAEGDIYQLHPKALCNSDDYYEEIHKFGWVGVIRLVQDDDKACMTLYEKAEKAIQRGATAVIFDITENPDASRQLQEQAEYQVRLTRPIVFIQKEAAVSLMEIVKSQRYARARIWSVSPVDEEESDASHYIIIGALVIVFLIVVCIILVFVGKMRRRSSEVCVDITRGYYQ